MSSSYNPHSSFIENHLNGITKCLNYHSFKYYNFTAMRVFNDCNGDTRMVQFCETYKPKKLITKTTRIKNIDNASSTDLILRNHYECFQGSELFETGSSDLHNLTYLVIKSCFQCRYNVKYRCQI